MSTIKKYGSLVLFMLSCFLYGSYVDAIVNCGKTVELHQFVMTGLVGIYFLVEFIDRIKNNQ